VDAQAGIEATFSIMNALLTRCTLVHDVAYIEYGSTSSMELLVIADEIIGMSRYLVEGVPVDQNTLALDAIARVEPGGGFIAEDHTMDNFRTAQWAPRVIDRNQYDVWVNNQSKDIKTRANQRAQQILAEHQVPPLPDEAEQVIKEILEERASD
jgi:trimethylamine--corrinoid protein Co-methyltransferase